MSSSFSYQISVWLHLLGIVVYIAGAAGLAGLASSHRKGIRLFHLLVLSPEVASGLYWTFAAVFVFSTLIFAVLVIRSLNWLPKSV
jgi:hypothetical protein